MAFFTDLTGMTPDQIFALSNVGLGALAGIGASWLSGKSSHRTKKLEHDFAKEKSRKDHDLELIRSVIDGIDVLETKVQNFMIATDKNIRSKQNNNNDFVSNYNDSYMNFDKIKSKLFASSYLIKDNESLELISDYLVASYGITQYFIERNSNMDAVDNVLFKPLLENAGEAKKKAIKRLSVVYREMV